MPKKSPYVTEEGYQALSREAKALWDKRRRVVVRLAAAAAEGDRSENADYIYRKKQLREIDRRIRYLQRRLPELQMVKRDPRDEPHRVYFGAWVTLEGNNGSQLTHRIVGADEFDAELSWISVDSPVARALLRREIDEEVEITTPGGTASYRIVDIRYHPPK